MKSILLFNLLIFSLPACALEDPTSYRQCFDSTANTLKSCVVSYGTSIHGKYLELNFRDKTYYIKQSTNCNKGHCHFVMGKDLHSLIEAKKYFLDYTFKVVSNNSNEKAWTCFKQVKGQENLCLKSN